MQASKKDGGGGENHVVAVLDEAFDDASCASSCATHSRQTVSRGNRRYPQAPCAPARANTTSRNPAASGCGGTRSAPSAAACARRIAESLAWPPSAGRAARRACWPRRRQIQTRSARSPARTRRAFFSTLSRSRKTPQIDQQRVAGGHRRAALALALYACWKR